MKTSSRHPDGNLGRCEPNDTRFPFAANASDQTPSHEIQFPPSLPFALPDNQGATPISGGRRWSAVIASEHLRVVGESNGAMERQI